MNWQTVSLDRVINEIVEHHQPRVRAAATLVTRSLREADDRWGRWEAAFGRAREVFDTFWSDLNAHLAHEQVAVFPAVRALMLAADQAAGVASGVLPLALQMEAEHDDVRAGLRQVRLACAACPVAAPAPAWAECARRVHGLSDALEALLMMENGVLYPRAIALAYAGASTGPPPHDRRVA